MTDINKMIYKALTTKQGEKIPNLDILDSLGISVLSTDCSLYNYYMVFCNDTKKCLVISKGYDRKKHLYCETLYTTLNTNDIKKVDFFGYLKKPYNNAYRNIKEEAVNL